MNGAPIEYTLTDAVEKMHSIPIKTERFAMSYFILFSPVISRRIAATVPIRDSERSLNTCCSLTDSYPQSERRGCGWPKVRLLCENEMCHPGPAFRFPTRLCFLASQVSALQTHTHSWLRCHPSNSGNSRIIAGIPSGNSISQIVFHP